MIRLIFGNNTYEFPNSWEELTTAQYVALVPLLAKFWSGELSLCDVRVLWFRKIAGLESVKVPVRYRDQFLDNIYTASRQFTFFYQIDFGDEAKILSKATREQLRKQDPDDFVHPTSEIRYASLLQYSYRSDSTWAKNLIPVIEVNTLQVKGWNVTVECGTLKASLTAAQFLLANDVLRSMASSGDGRNLALLTSILYPSDSDIGDYAKLPDDVLQGIVFNFQALVSFVFTRTHYSILWASDKKTSGKESISTPMSETLYSLSKQGYGNYDQIEQMPLTTYLSIMRNEMISGIRSMYDSKVKIDEIAERTNLPLNLILKIIQ